MARSAGGGVLGDLLQTYDNFNANLGEVRLKLAIGSLAKSIFWGGAMAASVAIVIAYAFFLPFTDGWSDVGEVALLLVWVAAISFAIVCAGALFLGLPATFVLWRLRMESETAYIAAGATFGFLLPLTVLLVGQAPAGHWLAMIGAVSGGIAGLIWWRTYRRQAVEAE